ncbi:MAG TPA: hypothetical protein VFU30_09680 [Gaiellaceae bacterium]|nr:hypothetical protein [Gaiellaceae bacterium]
MVVLPASSMTILAVDWGPVGLWVSATLTFLALAVTALVALGFFDYLRGPRIRITFEPTEPWCRQGDREDGSRGLWVRVGVENRGRGAARGCVGRLLTVSTDGRVRQDVDPVQLRWAGVPRSRAFDALDLGRGQREYLNVLYLPNGAGWHLVTFQDPDFDPGFAIDLPLDGRHAIELSVFSSNADTVTTSLSAEAQPGQGEPILQLR